MSFFLIRDICARQKEGRSAGDLLPEPGWPGWPGRQLHLGCRSVKILCLIRCMLAPNLDDIQHQHDITGTTGATGAPVEPSSERSLSACGGHVSARTVTAVTACPSLSAGPSDHVDSTIDFQWSRACLLGWGDWDTGRRGREGLWDWHWHWDRDGLGLLTKDPRLLPCSQSCSPAVIVGGCSQPM